MTIMKSSKIASAASSYATKFGHAVTLTPALSAINGLRSKDRGAVNIDVMIKQHHNYIDALKYAGAEITELNALAEFPDAQFVITGVLGPGSNAHGPNEFLHIPYAKKLTCCIVSILNDFPE